MPCLSNILHIQLFVALSSRHASICLLPGSGQVSGSGCCPTKIVGAVTYGLLEEGATPSDCSSPCIYTSYLPGDNKRYCFAPGNLTSVCTLGGHVIILNQTPEKKGLNIQILFSHLSHKTKPSIRICHLEEPSGETQTCQHFIIIICSKNCVEP